LAGDPEPQNFYEMFSEQVICAEPDPEWSLYGNLFRQHVAGKCGGRSNQEQML
jgi:hypothetical protein